MNFVRKVNELIRLITNLNSTGLDPGLSLRITQTNNHIKRSHNCLGLGSNRKEFKNRKVGMILDH